MTIEVNGTIRDFAHFRFCPACGHDGLELRSFKSVTCPACGFVYFHNCASAAAVIIETPLGILLEKRSREPAKGMLDLPGGFVDYGETAEAAAIREVEEELGLRIDLAGYLGSWPNRYVYRGVVYFTTDVVFHALLPVTFDLQSLRAEGGEVAEIVYVPAERLELEQIAFPSMRAALAEWLRRRGR